MNIARCLGRGALWTGMVIGLAALIAAPTLAQESTMRQITVTGTGVVSVAPDMAEIRAGVVSQAETAAAALAANSEAVSAVLAGLAERGITAPNVQTQSFSVSPIYGNRQPGSVEAPPVVGFRVGNQVLVRLSDVAETGAILDALVQLGANQVNGVSFRVSAPDAALDEARVAAVADARRKAALLSEAAGVTLGAVISIREDTAGVPGPVFRAQAALAEAVPIEAGEQMLSATVSVVFALQ